MINTYYRRSIELVKHHDDSKSKKKGWIHTKAFEKYRRDKIIALSIILTGFIVLVLLSLNGNLDRIFTHPNNYSIEYLVQYDRSVIRHGNTFTVHTSMGFMNMTGGVELKTTCLCAENPVKVIANMVLDSKDFGGNADSFWNEMPNTYDIKFVGASLVNSNMHDEGSTAIIHLQKNNVTYSYDGIDDIEYARDGNYAFALDRPNIVIPDAHGQITLDYYPQSEGETKLPPALIDVSESKKMVIVKPAEEITGYYYGHYGFVFGFIAVAVSFAYMLFTTIQSKKELNS